METAKDFGKRNFCGAWLLPFRRWDGYRDAVESALRQFRSPRREDEPEQEAEELIGR